MVNDEAPMTCAICGFAEQCIVLATNVQAIEKAVEGYRAHLERDHRMSADEVAARVEAFRGLANMEER